MGAIVDMPAPARSEAAIEIMAPAVPALRAWLAVETQWRVVAGMAGIRWLGLDYGAVEVVLRRLAIPEADAVFADLMMMEAEALSVLWTEGK